MKYLAPILAAVLLSSCSWAMVTKAPTKKHRKKVEYSECTRAPVAPIVDTALGVASTAGAFWAYKNAPDPSFDDSGAIKKGVRGSALVVGASSLLYYGSAVYGYYQVHQCNKFWKSK